MADHNGFWPKWVESGLNLARELLVLWQQRGLLERIHYWELYFFVHGVNQIATAIGGDDFNFEQKLMGKKYYAGYDALLGIWSMKFSLSETIKKGFKNTYMMKAPKLIRTKKGGCVIGSEMIVNGAKVYKDIADNALGVYSIGNDVKTAQDIGNSEASTVTGATGGGGRCYAMIN